MNLSPSLNCDSPLDVRLKSAMLADLLTLIGIPAVDPVLRPSTSTISKSSQCSSKMKLGSVSFFDKKILFYVYFYWNIFSVVVYIQQMA